MKILVFIPTYRCELQIKRVIKQFSPSIQEKIDTIIVVDNISPDETLINAIAEAKTVFTISNFIAWKNDDNYGLGGSHKAAMRYAVDNRFDYIIVLHGDDQANIADIAEYLTEEKISDIDCLLGARFMRGSDLQGYSKFRTFGNIVYNILFSLVTMRKIHDLGSGLNLYRVSMLEQFYYKKFPDDLTFNYIMLLASYNRNQRVDFFPISWREEDQRSNVKLFQQAFKVIKMLLTYSIQRRDFLTKEMRTRPHESYTGSIQFHIRNKKTSVDDNA